MEWKKTAFDWNQARAFLVTAEEGSLSAAARALGLTQPTLSRQVAGIEETLGVTLFERTSRALLLTQAGVELLEHFRSMGQAADRISIAATGQSQMITGHVAITATDLMATHYLPPILKDLRTKAPGLKIEIITSNQLSDLRRREARYRDSPRPPARRKLDRQTPARRYGVSLCVFSVPQRGGPPLASLRPRRDAVRREREP